MSTDGPKVVGLVGGVAAGKSTVAAMLAETGAAVVDADRLGHEVLEDAEVREALRARWGDVVFDAQERVDRRQVAEIVFGDDEARQFLNGLVHPRIRRRMRQQMDALCGRSDVKLIVLDAVLLIEAGLNDWCDAVVIVEADRKQRDARARDARGWTAQERDVREAAQMPPERKRSMSDFVINNDGTEDETRRQVCKLYRELTNG